MLVAMSKMIAWTVDSSGILELYLVAFKVVYKKIRKKGIMGFRKKIDKSLLITENNFWVFLRQDIIIKP